MTKEKRTRANFGQAVANHHWYKEQLFVYNGTLTVASSMPYMPGYKRILGGFDCLVDAWTGTPDGTTVAFNLHFSYVTITNDPVSGYQVRTSTGIADVPVLVGYYQTPYVWPTTSPRQSFNYFDELIVSIKDPGSGIKGGPSNMNVHVYFD